MKMRDKFLTGIFVSIFIVGFIIIFTGFMDKYEPKEEKFDMFYISQKTNLKGFKNVNITPEICYYKFFNERIYMIENPYKEKDWECLINNVDLWRFGDIRGINYDIIGYEIYCRCWKE